MSGLTLFGLFAVTAMLVCYAFEKRSPWFVLAFAFSCGLASAYGFLQGALGPVHASSRKFLAIPNYCAKCFEKIAASRKWVSRPDSLHRARFKVYF